MLPNFVTTTNLHLDIALISYVTSNFVLLFMMNEIWDRMVNVAYHIWLSSNSLIFKIEMVHIKCWRESFVWFWSTVVSMLPIYFLTSSIFGTLRQFLQQFEGLFSYLELIKIWSRACDKKEEQKDGKNQQFIKNRASWLQKLLFTMGCIQDKWKLRVSMSVASQKYLSRSCSSSLWFLRNSLCITDDIKNLIWNTSSYLIDSHNHYFSIYI